MAPKHCFIFGIVLIVLIGINGDENPLRNNNSQAESPDDDQSSLSPNNDDTNAESNTGDNRNSPGGESNSDSQESFNDNFSDKLEKMFGGNSDQSEGGVKDIFRKLDEVMSDLPNVPQNGSPKKGQWKLPPNLANNPCFQNHEKMQDFYKQASKFFPKPNDPDSDVEKDTDDVVEDMSESAMKCFAPMLDNKTRNHMCKMFSKKSVKGFRKLLHSGINCLKTLTDDEDEDDLDFAHQETIKKHFQHIPMAQWSSRVVEQMSELAPDSIGDDIVEGLSDDVFYSSLQKFGRLLARGRGGPTMQLAVRQRIAKWKAVGQMTTADLRTMGPGIVALDLDDMEDINPKAIADVDFGGLDLDLDDDDPKRLALGRLLQKGRPQPPAKYSQSDITRLMPFIKRDRHLVQNLDSRTLSQALPNIRMMDFDDDEAGLVCGKLRQSPEYDDESAITGAAISSMGNIAIGCGDDFFEKLPDRAVKDSFSSLKDMDFDESLAETLIDKMDLGDFKDFTEEKIKQTGKLAKAFSSDDISEMPDDVIERSLDDFDDVSMDDWKKQLLISKARHSNNNKLPPQLLQLPNLATSLSVWDVDDVSADDIKSRLKKAATLKWRASLASALFSKYKASLLPGQAINVKHIQELGNIATGISPDDIYGFPDNKDDILELASTLGPHENAMPMPQVEAVKEKLEKVFDFDIKDKIDVTDDDILQMAPFIQYMSKINFNKINFSPAAKTAFLTSMAKVSLNKNSRSNAMFLAGKGQEMVLSGVGPGEQASNDWDDKKIRQLNGLLIGMSADRIRSLPKEALLRNLDDFSETPLHHNEAKAVVEQVVEHDSSWNCRRGRLAQIGPYLKYLSEDKLKTICKSEMAAAASAILKGMEKHAEYRRERIRKGFRREEEEENRDGEKRIVKHIVESFTQDTRRRRRAVGGLTCNDIKTLGTKATLIDSAKLAMMDRRVEFLNCLETLGSFSDWGKEHLSVLLAHMKAVYGDEKTWKSDTIRKAGSIIAALSPEQIRTVHLTSIDAMASIGKHGLLDSNQLKAGFYRWLNLSKNNDAREITAPELSSLAEFMCGADTAQILQFSTKTFRGALYTIGRIRSCNLQQLEAFAAKAVETYGQNVAAWSEPTVADMGIVIGGLETSAVQKMTPKQISVISPDTIPHLPASLLHSMTISQIKVLSTNQANAVTQHQYDLLAVNRQNILNNKVTVPFETKTSQGVAGVHDTVLPAVLAVIVFTWSL